MMEEGGRSRTEAETKVDRTPCEPGVRGAVERHRGLVEKAGYLGALPGERGRVLLRYGEERLQGLDVAFVVSARLEHLRNLVVLAHVLDRRRSSG